MNALKEWLDFLRSNSWIKEKRKTVLDKMKDIDKALKAGKKVKICIPIEEVNSIAMDGNDEYDRVYINGLRTIIFWEDIEKAEICIQ
jgi:hypothetical protein